MFPNPFFLLLEWRVVSIPSRGWCSWKAPRVLSSTRLSLWNTEAEKYLASHGCVVTPTEFTTRKQCWEGVALMQKLCYTSTFSLLPLEASDKTAKIDPFHTQAAQRPGRGRPPSWDRTALLGWGLLRGQAGLRLAQALPWHSSASGCRGQSEWECKTLCKRSEIGSDPQTR